jgi:hypothetical protein
MSVGFSPCGIPFGTFDAHPPFFRSLFKACPEQRRRRSAVVSALKGHDFSRAVRATKLDWALAPASFCFQLFAIPQRLKPESEWAFCGTTKVVP